MTTLFPPILENQRQSIWFYGPELSKKEKFPLRFQMPIINDQSSDIQHIQISIKYKTTNRPAIAQAFMPDGASLFFSLGPRNGRVGLPPSDETIGWSYDEATGICEIKIPYRFFEGGYPKNGCEYTIQMRFGANRLWNETETNMKPGFHIDQFLGFSAWFNTATAAVPSPFGEWSNIQNVFCIEQATTTLSLNVNKTFVPEINWQYDSPTINGKILDAIEQVVLQWDYNIDNGLGQTVRQFRTQTFTGAYNNSGKYSFVQQIPIAPVVPIHISLTAITQHNTVYVNNVNITPEDSLWGGNKVTNCEFSEFELKKAQKDDGCIAKSIKFKEGSCHGDTLMVFRYDLKTFDCILVKQTDIVTQEFDRNGNKVRNIEAIYTVKDYTIAMGEEYQYVPVVYHKERKDGEYEEGIQLCVDLIGNDGVGTIGYGRLMEMEITFLNDRYHQLRIPGNLTITNFKRNTSDQFQSTLGSKYPYYIRGGAQNYRTLQVSAVISANFDPTFTFLRLEDDYGLVWEDAESRQLLIDRKDIFGIEEFSRSRWRLGHFHGEKEENPKIGILGYDGFEDWLAFDKDMLDNEKQTVESLYNTVPKIKELIDTGRIKKNIRGILIAIETYEITHTDIPQILNDYETKKKALEEQYKNQNVYKNQDGKYRKYEERQVTIQGENADYRNKSIYSRFYMKNDLVNIDTSHSDEMVYLERKFRDAAMSWLSDGKPKLYRSETEGNMIVIISNPSFTPLNKTQRMVYSVSMTLTEIADYNLQNLIEYNLVPSEIISEYIPNGEWDFSFGNPDPWVGSYIGLFYTPDYDIPPTKILANRADIVFPEVIDMSKALVNYYNPPFYWEAVDLPPGVEISNSPNGITDKGGKVTGNKYQFVVGPASKATIYVWDRWNYDEMQQKKATLSEEEYDKWLSDEKKDISKHDSTSMTIKVGQFYNELAIEWFDPNTGTPKIGSPKITVQSVGEKIPAIYFRVNPDAIGTPPYSWGLNNGNVPFGIEAKPSGFNNQEYIISGVFSQAMNEGGTFTVVCTDAKNLTDKIEVSYSPVHTPVYFASLQDTATLTDWEENIEIQPVNYYPQVYYGVRNEQDVGDFEFEMLFYDNNKNIVRTPNALPGIEIDQHTGILRGTPEKNAVEYPYTLKDKVILRVYDMNDIGIDGELNVIKYEGPNGDGKYHRYSQIEVTIDTILEEFVFIKPEDIDPELWVDSEGNAIGKPLIVGRVMPSYDIQIKRVNEDGELLTGDDANNARPPVRGGLARTGGQPYLFYARAPYSGNILGNFSVNSKGLFTGTMVQTANAGIMQIVAVDARGHEVSINVNIPAVDGKFKIIPTPSNKFTIPSSEVGQEEPLPEEWFRVYSQQPDVEGTEDDLKGELGEFKNFQISVEGIPAGIIIEKVPDPDDPKKGYFVFKGTPVGNIVGIQTDADLKAKHDYLVTIDWEKFVTNSAYRQTVSQGLEDRDITLGVGTHFGSMKITDNFTVELPNGAPEVRARTATHTILIAGVSAPFIWSNPNPSQVYSIPQYYADVCVTVGPISLPRISGGMAPFHWKEESLADLKPYEVFPSSNGGEVTGGFDRDAKIYITGSPTTPQPAKDVDLTLVDANGCERSITISLGEIKEPIKITPAEQWGESFILNHSNASNGKIRVATVLFDESKTVFKYKGMENATLPNGMILDKRGYLQGKATILTGQIDIGPDIVIEITDGDITQSYVCPTFILPATVKPPQPAFPGEYVIDNLIYNTSFTSDPLFIFEGGNGLVSKMNLDDVNKQPPKQLLPNDTYYVLSGTLFEETHSDIVCTYNLTVATQKTGDNQAVTGQYQVSQTVRFKPIPTKFGLFNPSSDFYMSGLTVGVPMEEKNLTNGLVYGGTMPVKSWEIRVLKPDGTKESYGLEHYGISYKFGDTNKTQLILYGTPNQKSYDPITFSVKATDATDQVSQEIQFTIPGIYDQLKCTNAPIAVAGGRLNAATDTSYKLITTGGSGKPENYEYSDPNNILSNYECELEPRVVNGVMEWYLVAHSYSMDTSNRDALTGTIKLRDKVSKQEVWVTVNLGAIMDAKPGLKIEAINLTGSRGTLWNQDLGAQIVAADKTKFKFEVSLNTPLSANWVWNTATADGFRTDQTGDKRTIYNNRTLYVKFPNNKSRFPDNKLPQAPAETITLELKDISNPSTQPYQVLTVTLPPLPAVN